MEVGLAVVRLVLINNRVWLGEIIISFVRGWMRSNEMNFKARCGDDGRASISLLCYYHVAFKRSFAAVFKGDVFGPSPFDRWPNCCPSYLGEGGRVDPELILCSRSAL